MFFYVYFFECLTTVASNNPKRYQEKMPSKMLRLFYISFMCLLFANAHPLSCKEDAHCSEGYFCDTQANVCQKCLECSDLKRLPPKLDVTSECIQIINSCGPCADGFINIYGKDFKGKCVAPGLFEFGRSAHYVYVCATAAVIGLLLVLSFMFVFKHTDVFRVVTYYHLMTGNTPATVTPVSNIASPQHLVKYLAHFAKNPSNK